jgi:4-hydroxybenzoate polyprenyltransferase
MWDKNIDKNVARTMNRPLASNELNYGEAFIFTMMHLSGGLFVLAFLNPPAIFYSFYGFIIG